jgi:Cellulase (glycosyl hydrolase family 5)
MRSLLVATLALFVSLGGLPACSSSRTFADGPGAAGLGGGSSGAATAGGGASGSGAVGGGATGGGSAGVGGADASAGAAGTTDTPGVPASMTKGWLYTAGNRIFVSNGPGVAGTPWVGRGVNADDLFFCGYNWMLETQNAEALLKTEMDGLFNAWKPSFVRMSLGMASYPTKVSWLGDDAKYKTPMINVIRAIGAHPNTYVLVTLRSDETMIGFDPGNAEPTGIPSDATNSPDKTLYPTGTDAVYAALVDTFAHDPFVLFGITNEAGGNRAGADEITAAMSHAVSTIRAEEDKLAVPHHLISVQGTGYTGNISFYDKKPLTQDNVIYEEHAYPPIASGYTFDNIPVIVGEYGNLDAVAAAAFFQDVETKKIPTLAWDFDPYSNCAPDLLDITKDASMLNPTDWGKIVQGYLVSHATP